MMMTTTNKTYTQVIKNNKNKVEWAVKRLKTAADEDNCCAEVGETGDDQKDVGDGRKVMRETEKRQGDNNKGGQGSAGAQDGHDDWDNEQEQHE